MVSHYKEGTIFENDAKLHSFLDAMIFKSMGTLTVDIDKGREKGSGKIKSIFDVIFCSKCLVTVKEISPNLMQCPKCGMKWYGPFWEVKNEQI